MCFCIEIGGVFFCLKGWVVFLRFDVLSRDVRGCLDSCLFGNMMERCLNILNNFLIFFGYF